MGDGRKDSVEKGKDLNVLRAHVGLIVRPWEEVEVNVLLPLGGFFFLFGFGEAEKNAQNMTDKSFHDPLSCVLWKENEKKKEETTWTHRRWCSGCPHEGKVRA